MRKFIDLCKEIYNIERFRLYADGVAFFVFTASVSFFYTNNTTRAGYSKDDQFYAAYPVGTELLCDTGKVYVSGSSFTFLVRHHVAAIFASTFYGFFTLFSGFFIPRPRIPKWWIWYYWICPVAWTVYGLIVTQYGDIEDTIKVPGIEPDPTIKWYVENHFGYNLNFMGSVAAVLASFAIFFAILFAVSIKIFNFQQR